MSPPLVFQAGVRDEIDEAYAWHQAQRPGLGEGFLAALRAVLDRIRADPELHAPVFGPVRHARVRRFPYAVDYRIDPDRLAVIAVHHGKRDPGRWQSGA